MPSVIASSSLGFTPTLWVMPHPGTNGYVSTWGAILAGVTPHAQRSLSTNPTSAA